MSIIDRGRESGFRWPLTSYIRETKCGRQMIGLADLSTPGALIETDAVVEVRR